MFLLELPYIHIEQNDVQYEFCMFWNSVPDV